MKFEINVEVEICVSGIPQDSLERLEKEEIFEKVDFEFYKGKSSIYHTLIMHTSNVPSKGDIITLEEFSHIKFKVIDLEKNFATFNGETYLAFVNMELKFLIDRFKK